MPDSLMHFCVQSHCCRVEQVAPVRQVARHGITEHHLPVATYSECVESMNIDYKLEYT